MEKTVCAVVVLLSTVSCALAATGIGRATVHDSKYSIKIFPNHPNFIICILLANCHYYDKKGCVGCRIFIICMKHF